MKKIIYPEKKDWMEILRRPALNTDTLRNTVKDCLLYTSPSPRDS